LPSVTTSISHERRVSGHGRFHRFVIDNQQHCLADALNELLAQSGGKAPDVATAYFAISGYRLGSGRSGYNEGNGG
jgi:hypothetical protein